MDIDGVFLPVAKELIDVTFPTPITYIETGNATYDPASGQVTPNETTHSINAGILSRGRVEAGGIDEQYELRLWVHHGGGGLPVLPKTSDRVLYDSAYWKVMQVNPTYSSDSLIASKLILRAE